MPSHHQRAPVYETFPFSILLNPREDSEGRRHIRKVFSSLKPAWAVPNPLLPPKRCGIVREVTKNTLIDHVAEVTQGTKKEAERVIEAILTSITEALLKKEKVDLRGFGSFQVSDKKERQGRNPQTGATITIAARSVAVFKPSKELAVRLNEAGLKSQPD